VNERRNYNAQIRLNLEFLDALQLCNSDEAFSKTDKKQNDRNVAKNILSGIYFPASLAPILMVRQAETEAGACEGRLPLLV